MAYKAGTAVIVTKEGVNHVGVILEKHIVNKQTMYDILLENRSAIIMVNTSSAKKVFINKMLTTKLCDTGIIECNIPYKDMLANDTLPICHA